MTTSIISAVGEHYVLNQLLRRDWIACLAPARAPNIDILVVNQAIKAIPDITLTAKKSMNNKVPRPLEIFLESKRWLIQ